MAQNANFARIYGSDLDAIWLAPLGSTLPTTISAAPAAPFEDVGWLNSDGISEALTGSRNKIRGHQGNGVVRSRMTEPGTEISFTALETKKQTLALRYYEKTSAIATGVKTATRGPGQRVAVRAAVIDIFDADDTTIKERFCIPRFEIVANGDRVATYTDIAGFPFLGEIIGDYTHYMNTTET
jgi:hypothetical protein